MAALRPESGSASGRAVRPGSRLLRVVALAIVAGGLLLPRPAPGTVAEQRARLPPPAECEHAVEGIWRSHAYNPRYRDWVEFTLEVRRVHGDEQRLSGRIVNHTWKGGPEHEQAGPCSAASPWRARIVMPATGSYRQGQISFRGTEWKLDQVVCGKMPGGWGYNLDHFTGTIDPKLQEFQSVNNDGGRSVNEPTVFRRIGCFEQAPPPSVQVETPAFQPPRRSQGCGCD